MKKIAMFGGTFNPIHFGHIRVALYFREKLNLNKVIFMPTLIPPHKEMTEKVDPYARYDMCLLETDKYSYFETSDIELQRKGKSYTIDTLRKLSQIYKDSKLYLIMGADMFVTIEEWKEYKEILSLADICTFPRGEYDYKFLMEYKDKFLSRYECFIADMPLVDVSSSEIRNMVSENKPISNLVSSEVEKYIYEKGLYHG